MVISWSVAGGSLRSPARQLWPASRQLPPRSTRPERCAVSVHCHTFPCMSHRPNLFERIGPHPCRPHKPWSRRCRAERLVAVEVRHCRRKFVRWLIEVEEVRAFFLGSGSGPTGVFPFRLTRQAVQITTPDLFFIQLLDKLPGVIPGHIFDRKQLQLFIGDVLNPVPAAGRRERTSSGCCP